jgi:oligosaccharyltransferase complex subunit alpha (ribophorin I)
LERGYPRETINVVVKNTDSTPQSEYYLLFESDVISKVGGLEVRDKKNTEAGPFKVALAKYQSPK